jgi:hypothetical protein
VEGDPLRWTLTFFANFAEQLLCSPPIDISIGRAGSVWINTHNFGDVALPFGGYKESGWGREMGKEVLELYTETKAVAAML